jgi:hypothetical protein
MEYLKFTPELAHDWKNALSSSEPYLFKRVMDSMNQSQLESKLWIVNELSELMLFPKSVALLAGWYANFITPLLIDELGVKYILNLDSDPDVKTISYKFNKRYKINKDHTKNRDDGCLYRCEMHDVMFEPIKKYGDFDLVINTSCEHMFSMSRFRKLNKSKNYIYVLQSSNDRQYDDHINCVDSADELADQADIVDVMYSGEMKLSNSMTRYMVIGR